MKEYVIDTHTLLWFLARDKKLSSEARRILTDAKEGRVLLYLPSIMLVEIVFLLQRERVAESVFGQAFELAEQTEGEIRVVPLDTTIAREVAAFGPAAIPEMADRIIAATARVLGVPLVTADTEIANTKLVQVIW